MKNHVADLRITVVSMIIRWEGALGHPGLHSPAQGPSDPSATAGGQEGGTLGPGGCQRLRRDLEKEIPSWFPHQPLVQQAHTTA